MSSGKKILVLDFDGTLTTQDTCFLFIRWMNKKFRRSNLKYYGILFFYLIGIIDNDRYKKLLARLTRGLCISENHYKQFYQEKCQNIIRPSMRKLLHHHQIMGFKTIIISASFMEWISIAAEDLNVDKVIANQFLLSETGENLGSISGPNVYGLNKIQFLDQYLNDQHEDLRSAIAYSDNQSDLILLKTAGQGYYVINNPWKYFWFRFSNTCNTLSAYKVY